MFGFLRKRHRQADAAKLRRYIEQREANRVAARTPLGQLDPLVRELIELGNTHGLLHNKRAREIGEELNARGGRPLMQAVYYEVFNWHPVNARGLQHTWDGIGDWMA